MNPKLSILCVTRGEEHAVRFVEELIDLSGRCKAQAVVILDFNTNDLESLVGFGARYLVRAGNKVHITVGNVHSKGFIESVLDESLSFCVGDYVLRIDDDERVSDAMADWLAAESYLTHPHWKFSRAHLWGDERHYVTDLPLWPDHQTRLSLRRLSGQRPSIHSGSPYGGGELAPCVIEHHKFLVKSPAQRRAIVERYDSVAPGMGQAFRAFSVPEDVPELARLNVRPLAEVVLA